MVTWRKFHTEDPQILVATVQNGVLTTRRPGRVHSCTIHVCVCVICIVSALVSRYSLGLISLLFMKLFIMQFSPAPILLLLPPYCVIILSVSLHYMKLVSSGWHIDTCVCIMIQVRTSLPLTPNLCLQECWGRGGGCFYCGFVSISMRCTVVYGPLVLQYVAVM